MRYDYECQECKDVYEVIQSMKDDRLEEHHCPKCDKISKCSRIVYGGTGFIWTCDAPTVNSSSRGYKGKFKNKIRPAGTPVDAPVHKGEADKQFQNWVDSGGLQGVAPTVDLNKTSAAPQTAEQMVDKSYKPGKKKFI